MASWFLRSDGRQETFWFDPEWSDAPLAHGPQGALAVAVFQSLDEGDKADDGARLKDVVNRGRDGEPVPAVNWARVGADLAAIRRQLTSWYSVGVVRWNPLYGVEAYEGPCPEIPGAFLDEIHWRGPGDVVADSVSAAVLVSAVNGAFTRTLFTCMACRALLVRSAPGAAWRQKRCPTCRPAWKTSKKDVGLHLELQRLSDRARKKYFRARDRNEKKRQVRLGGYAVFARYTRGELTLAQATAQIRDVLPVGPRGRRRSR